MDVDINVEDEFDEENDANDVIMSENEDESNSKSSTPNNIELYKPSYINHVDMCRSL